MPLWKATVSIEMELVVASDDEPTDSDFRFAARDEIHENGVYGVDCGPISRVVGPADIPREWRDSAPHEGDGESCFNTLFMEAQARAEAALPDPRQAGLFGGAPAAPDEVEQIRKYQRLLEPLGEVELLTAGATKEAIDALQAACDAETPAVRKYYEARGQ
jgi:hypothetical protein